MNTENTFANNTDILLPSLELKQYFKQKRRYLWQKIQITNLKKLWLR